MNDPEAQQRRYMELHRGLDELVAYFLDHHRGKVLANTTLLELLDWSYAMAMAAGQRLETQALAAQLRALEHALTESVRLQSHYAGLLNAQDGGTRHAFTVETWLARLAETPHPEAPGP